MMNAEMTDVMTHFSVTDTSTTTVWETETQWETASEDATTTEETTKTEDSTIRVTVSNVDTGTTTITTTTYITDAAARLAKRAKFAYPTKTQWLDPLDANPTMAPTQIFNIKPAQSLNALAEVLLRRGVWIDRRDTATETNWVTDTSTTTEVDTTTQTEWHTEYSTEFETEKITLTNYVDAKEMVTVTKTETKHVDNSDSNPESSTSDLNSDSATDSSTSTSTSDPDSSALGNSNKSDSNSLPIGTIVGAAVGGFAGIILILVAIWWCRRRNRNTHGPPPVVAAGHNDTYHFPPPVAETQSPKPQVPVPPVHTPPVGYGHIPRNHYEADGVGVTAWTQEQRHRSTNSWGSSPPLTYARNTPGELSSTPALHGRHAELASSPRMHPYEMAGSQGYHQQEYGR
ncbi:hypothetical protein EDB81DRAFT_297168 [Dactylonectria macrodidyma]|uniref:Mid2 domain-containing protein n=1 Tax=Dactylonectria macrodidyma TaxID=307937 RepID=A0A9P9ICW5_9HYPO|nr:hypothetical protein EDB81DRAFT_297168 [Dactylonectria macrodidyma]